LKHKSIKIDENLAVCLLLGILTDTGHLRHANLNTFRTITAILEESDVKLDYVQSILETCELMDTAEMYSIKIANLKCMQRVKYEVVGEGNDPSNRVIVATSYVGAHESSACKVLLFAGADVAFVGSEHQHKVRISARAKTDIVNRGLHLAKLLQAVAEDCACESGGHAGAAGLTGYGDVETILNICASKIKAWGLSNLVR
jgi:nanoRNase/pAp phosphatase (c-di-AMP/oligoRNAs hydrolase)